jgi:hypothetical protein
MAVPLSYRNIEEMMAKRGVPVTYKTVREWCQKFGCVYAARLRKRRVAPRDYSHRCKPRQSGVLRLPPPFPLRRECAERPSTLGG